MGDGQGLCSPLIARYPAFERDKKEEGHGITFYYWD
jgi:hypothetical protein